MGNTQKKPNIKKQKSLSLLKRFKSNSKDNLDETLKDVGDNVVNESHLDRQGLLVFAFITTIGKDLKESEKYFSIFSMIPTSIYHLCLDYSKNLNNDYCYVWCFMHKNVIFSRNIHHLSEHKYSLDLKWINDTHTDNKLFDKTFSSSVLVRDIPMDIIPVKYDKIWKVNDITLCGIIRIGGKYVSPEEFSSKCNMILFQSPNTFNVKDTSSNKIIDAYVEQLPNLIQPISCSATIYDECSSIIYNIGGINNMKQIQNRVSSLEMNQNVSGWNQHNSLSMPRYQPSLSWIGGDNHENLMVCGGCSNWITPTNNCELIRFDNGDIREIVNISPMNFPRAFVKAARCESHKIVIGGGMLKESSAYSIEFYDGNVDKWTNYAKKTNYRHDHATVWCSHNNRNIIMIGDNVIEFTDIRCAENEWQLLKESDSHTSDLLNPRRSMRRHFLI